MNKKSVKKTQEKTATDFMFPISGLMVALAVGVLLLIAFIFKFDTENRSHDLTRLAQIGIETTGIIDEKVVLGSGGSRRSPRTPIYRIKGTFPGNLDAPIPFDFQVQSYDYMVLEEGGRVALVYDPDDPANIDLQSAVSEWNGARFEKNRGDQLWLAEFVAAAAMLYGWYAHGRWMARQYNDRINLRKTWLGQA